MTGYQRFNFDPVGYIVGLMMTSTH